MTTIEGPWIELVTGAWLQVREPRPADISIEAIAFGLAGAFRFGAQSRPRITVAEHSILASELAEKTSGGGVRLATLMLLHDAHEGLGLGDLPRPYKGECPAYRSLCDRIQAAVWRAMNVQPPSPKEAGAMRFFDEVILATEARHAAFKDHLWGLPEQPNADVDLAFWPPEEAEQVFFARWKDLASQQGALAAVSA